ncbi:unnamed protein product [Durusdinium trenchii]|uniref:Uncharacterized protein n=1 Tax=Durusdinium trenchii TaxID=1381693 RepID=A0ABP0J627_9DINO
MCEGKCCNELGSSSYMQLFYIVACAIYAVVLLAFFIMGLVEADLNLNTALVEYLLNVGAVVVFVLITTSRCCAPCCCPEQMPDVPRPCPCGPCSSTNLVLLDYPFLIAIGGQFTVEFLVSSLIHWTMDFEYEDGVEILHMARLINVIWMVLATVGICAGLRRYQLMQAQIVAPITPAHGVHADLPMGTVVGLPVVGNPVSPSVKEP